MEKNTLQLKKFLDNPDEKIVLAEREHWVLPLYNSVIAFLVSTPFYAAVYVAETLHLITVSQLAALGLVITVVLLSIISKITIDWYLHLYIITNKKILEIRYTPLFSYQTYGVLLEQVRCTEVDDTRSGVLRELLNIGDITITFDRPTHEEEFTLHNMADPINVGWQLRNLFSSMNNSPSQQVWYRLRKNTSTERSMIGNNWRMRYV